jgi:hypothetical protein
MKKKDIPLILIILSFILIVGNIIKTDYHTIGFWLRVSSSLLLIIGMYLVIRNRKKES